MEEKDASDLPKKSPASSVKKISITHVEQEPEKPVTEPEKVEEIPEVTEPENGGEEVAESTEEKTAEEPTVTDDASNETEQPPVAEEAEPEPSETEEPIEKIEEEVTSEEALETVTAEQDEAVAAEPEEAEPEAEEVKEENEPENTPDEPAQEDEIGELKEEPEPANDKELDEMLSSVSEEDIPPSPQDRRLPKPPVLASPQIPAKQEQKRSFKQKLGGFFKAWWNNPIARYGTLGLLLVSLAVCALVPSVRYPLLNTFGVRVSMSMKVFDEKSNLPLQGVDVVVGDVSAKTAQDGKVKLDGLKLGKQTVVIKKRAYAQKEKAIVLGWGSNPLEDIGISSTGSRFSFELKDWLSGKPISQGSADVSYLDNTVTNNDKGIAELAIEPTDEQEITIKIKAPHYQEVSYKLDTATKDTQKITLVADDRHYYMSRRSGKYDLYSSYLDGTDETLILAGTGQERDDLVLSVNDDATWLALVSTRDGERNKDGYTKMGLLLIDLKDKTHPVKKLSSSERIQLVGWYGNRLVYVRVAEGASATNPKRHRLVSYDPDNGEVEIAAANYFNDVSATKDYVFYAPSNAYQETAQPYLFRVKPDGSDKQKLFDKEAWNIFRQDYDTLVVAFQQDWYSVNIQTKALKKLDGQPNALKSRLYSENNDSKQALWQEERDGKGTLLFYDKASKQDKVVLTQSGLGSPAYFVRDAYVVYRVSTPSETADYVMPIDGDKGTKISDVSKTASIDRWYYY